ncbi:MAG TPA: FG-GAP-like repeat-containing protein, partial [Terriglobales bacterium]|nr:FG-GAP-like repeat-containing protein [Terriglobales bacterium]
DVDGNGSADLVTLNEAGEDGPSLSVLLNHGNGSFAAEERLNLAGSRYLVAAMAAADFDGDGFGDLAVAVNDIRQFPPTAAVLVYRNSGDGQFRAPAEYSIDGVLPSCVRTADVDGDQQLDLVVCHADRNDGSGAVSILTAKGGGVFEVSLRRAVGLSPSDVLIADVDADGRIDLVVVDPAADSLSVLYGSDGEERFAAPAPITDIGSPAAVALHQVGDGAPSLLVANVSGGELLTLEQVAPRQFEIASSQLVDAAPSELALLEAGQNKEQLAATASFAADGIGVLELGVEEAIQSAEVLAPSDLIAVDFNADGRLDLATTSLTGDAAAVFLAGSEPASEPSPTPTEAQAQQTPTSPIATTTAVVVTATPGLVVTATPIRTATATSAVPAQTSTSTPTRTWTPTPTATATLNPTHGPVEPGDANCDGSVDDLDGYAIIEQLFLNSCEGADINGDGMVSSADIVLFYMIGEEL